jgi:transposase
LERSFLPGRTFSSPADFNTQLAGWLATANRRVRRVLGCAPIDRITADRAAMLSVPPVAPVTGWRASTRLARDHYIRLDSNDYSVHPAVIGRRVEIVADLTRVRVHCDGRVVADHDRLWAKHQTVSDPEHVAAAKTLRRDRIALVGPAAEPEVEIRCLADYDTALGLDGIEGVEGGVA